MNIETACDLWAAISCVQIQELQQVGEFLLGCLHAFTPVYLVLNTSASVFIKAV